jgi:hypothetical protein
LWWLAAVVGCGGDGPPASPHPGDDPTTPSLPTEFPIEVAVDPDHPTVATVSFDADPAATTFVRFGYVDLDRVTPSETAGARRTHTVLGLKAGRTATVQAVEVRDGVERVSDAVPVDVPALPDDVPPLSLQVDLPGSRASEGYVLLVVDLYGHPSTQFYIVIVDGDGDVVWLHSMPEGRGTSGVYPATDGSGLVYPEYDNYLEELDGRIIRMELDGDVLSTTDAPGIHHAMAQLPGNRFAYLGHTFMPGAILDAEGDWLLTDNIHFVEEGESAPIGSTLEFVTQWLGNDLALAWLDPCEQVWDTLYGYRDVCELTHSNSLAYSADDDALYVYARFFDTLLKLDGTTGEQVWQLSGMYSDFSFADGDPVYRDVHLSYLWSQGHFSHVWDGGMLMFDNGVAYLPQTSSLVEVAWDESTMTVEEVWRYADPEGGFTYAMGDARKLSNGNVLASWMDLSKVTEVTPAGEEVWRFDVGAANVRRVYYLPDLYDLSTFE